MQYISVIQTKMSCVILQNLNLITNPSCKFYSIISYLIEGKKRGEKKVLLFSLIKRKTE